MKIKHYIVTYKNPIWERCAESILACPVSADCVREIFVLNNHTNFVLPDHLRFRVFPIHNQGRPDFSTGHLARSWNQGLIHGFRSLKAPDADIVVLSQNDAEFHPDYLPKLLDLHQSFDIVTHGEGDNCVTYTATGVRRVGLWDERFCGIGHQEGDYFLRVVKYLKERASVTDRQHGRFHQPVQAITRALPTGHARREPSHLAATPYHALSEQMFFYKWGNMTGPMFWNQQDNDPNHAEQKMNNFVFYPYFEHDVETLVEQHYIHLQAIPDPEPADRPY
jgi:hypothetical protein